MKARWCFSANFKATSVGTARKCRRSSLLPTNITDTLSLENSRISRSHRSHDSNVCIFAEMEALGVLIKV